MRPLVTFSCVVAAAAALVSPLHAAEDSLTHADLAKLGKPATVYVENVRGSGSGFCVHPSGLFVTNEHVVAGADTATVVIDSNLKTQRVVTAKVIRSDKDLDLALLRADGVKDLPTLSLGSVDRIVETMDVVALGFPFGKLLDAQPNEYPAVSVNAGSVTSLRMKDGALHRLQVDIALNPGNSGGPVLGPDGKVGGVVVSGVRGSGVNFVIPVSHLATFLAKPELDFQPPALTRATAHKPAEFRARAASLLPGGKPLSLELILTDDGGKARPFPMDKDGDAYAVKAVPVPARDGPARLHASFTYDGGAVSGLVADGPITVGGKSFKLGELRGLRWQAGASATSADGKTLEGAIDAGAGFDVDLGGEVIRLKPGAMRSATFEPIPEAATVACVVVIRQGDQEVARVSRTLIVTDPSARADSGAATIRPAVLEQDTVVRPLPDAADDVTVGGGGRYLIFRLPKQRQLAVFDANEAKVVKYLPLAEDGAKVAAGLDKLIIALPASHVLQRWSLTTFEKEVTAPCPVNGTVAKMVMGSATRGPLVVGTAGARTPPLFLDPLTFKDAGYQVTENAGGFLNVPDDGTQVRISANGEVLTSWMVGSSPMGLSTLVREGNTYKPYYQHTTVGEIFPSADGRTLFTRQGQFTAETKEISKSGDVGGHAVWYAPALQGSYYLSFTQAGDAFKGGLVFNVGICLAGETRPLVALPGSKDYDGLVNWQFGQGQVFDRHVFLIPDAGLLVLLPASNDKLILRRFNLDELLEKSGVDYLFVASRPVTQAVKGATYSYAPVGKSKKGGVRLKLDSGPPGMVLSSDGRLTWAVPADFAEAEAPVVLTVTDASGQEVLHTFKVAVSAP